MPTIRSLIRLVSAVSLTLTAMAQTPLQITNITRQAASNAVTVQWRGGQGPYLLRTSQELLTWSDQGEPATGRSRQLAAFGPRSFYRVADLNPTNLYGLLFGLIQTDQGEFGGIFARHRLKSRLWLYKTTGAPHTSATYRPTNYWGKLLANFQTHSNGQVQTWTGPLENLGTVTTPGNARTMTITWTNGAGPAQRIFSLSFVFPYNINTSRANSGTTAPNASDPMMTLRCAYATAVKELNFGTTSLSDTTMDSTVMYQLDPANASAPWLTRDYVVAKNGVRVSLHYLEGLPLIEGNSPFIWKTFILDRWLSPSTAGGGSLPTFSTDSYFSRTLLPGHHNFVETVLLEPALDPALSSATRAALSAANIRYLYTFKDHDIGLSDDDIRYIGFDNTVRSP